MGDNKKHTEHLDSLLKMLLAVENEFGLALFITLVVVARYPGISVNELAERIQAPQQTASRYVATLQGRYQMPGNTGNEFVKHPFVSLEVNNADPRKRALFITQSGQAKLTKILELLEI